MFQGSFVPPLSSLSIVQCMHYWNYIDYKRSCRPNWSFKRFSCLNYEFPVMQINTISNNNLRDSLCCRTAAAHSNQHTNSGGVTDWVNYKAQVRMSTVPETAEETSALKLIHQFAVTKEGGQWCKWSISSHRTKHDMTKALDGNWLLMIKI